jgi:soluble lytic murein transglycosylase-like protein
MGCRHLAALRRRHGTGDDLEALAAAYNAGSPRRNAAGCWVNQRYVDKVRESGGFR